MFRILTFLFLAISSSLSFSQSCPLLLELHPESNVINGVTVQATVNLCNVKGIEKVTDKSGNLSTNIYLDGIGISSPGHEVHDTIMPVITGGTLERGCYNFIDIDTPTKILELMPDDAISTINICDIELFYVRDSRHAENGIRTEFKGIYPSILADSDTFYNFLKSTLSLHFLIE